jgi:predicted dehydrogenase
LGQLANVHLSWRSPVRRTSATIYGNSGLLEIEGDRVVLTPREGAAEDHSAEGAPDDSYHRPWFAALAAHFLDAIAEGCEGPIVRRNHAEVRFALAATSAARKSAMSSGIAVKLGQP